MEEKVLDVQTLRTLSGLLGIAGFIPYILPVWRTRHLSPVDPRKVLPMKATWTIWPTLNTIICANLIREGTVNPQIIGITIGSITVGILAWKYGDPRWTGLDKVCMSLAILAGLVTLINPSWSIALSLIVVMIAWAPTVKSVFLFPERENRLAWTIFTFSSVCMVLAVREWDINHAGQPLTFLANQSITCFLAWVRWRPRMLVGA